MAAAEKMKTLIEDCQRDIAAYPPPDSYIAPKELLALPCRVFCVVCFHPPPIDSEIRDLALTLRKTRT
ncbi:hypothetical protein I6F26_03565 [Ensifer sp. IC3342]|nr:hypothetical protein [Ensifer sp. BRP08]MCA1445670.1 hypothetical protein [Ensifer sp. IC3342]